MARQRERRTKLHGVTTSSASGVDRPPLSCPGSVLDFGRLRCYPSLDCDPARGLDAGRHYKLLMQVAFIGATSCADPHKSLLDVNLVFRKPTVVDDVCFHRVGILRVSDQGQASLGTAASNV